MGFGAKQVLHVKERQPPAFRAHTVHVTTLTPPIRPRAVTQRTCVAQSMSDKLHESRARARRSPPDAVYARGGLGGVQVAPRGGPPHSRYKSSAESGPR